MMRTQELHILCKSATEFNYFEIISFLKGQIEKSLVRKAEVKKINQLENEIIRLESRFQF